MTDARTLIEELVEPRAFVTELRFRLPGNDSVGALWRRSRIQHHEQAMDCVKAWTADVDKFGFLKGSEAEIVPVYFASQLATIAEAFRKLEAERDELRNSVKRLVEVYGHMETGDGEPCPEIAKARRLVSGTKAESIAGQLEAENRELRQIISDCAAALPNGAFIAPACSVEFMRGLPKEIALVTKGIALNATREDGE